MQGAAIYSGWRALQGLTSVNQYWGIITVSWVPGASMAAASLVAIAATVLWYMTDSKSKAGLLGGQLAVQLLCAGCTLLAVVCWAYPIRVDPQVRGRGACAGWAATRKHGARQHCQRRQT
jgi:hypothetical protein